MSRVSGTPRGPTSPRRPAVDVTPTSCRSGPSSRGRRGGVTSGDTGGLTSTTGASGWTGHGHRVSGVPSRATRVSTRPRTSHGRGIVLIGPGDRFSVDGHGTSRNPSSDDTLCPPAFVGASPVSGNAGRCF